MIGSKDGQWDGESGTDDDDEQGAMQIKYPAAAVAGIYEKSLLSGRDWNMVAGIH
jgi:hypothetical protein